MFIAVVTAMHAIAGADDQYFQDQKKTRLKLMMTNNKQDATSTGEDLNIKEYWQMGMIFQCHIFHQQWELWLFSISQLLTDIVQYENTVVHFWKEHVSRQLIFFGLLQLNISLCFWTVQYQQSRPRCMKITWKLYTIACSTQGMSKFTNHAIRTYVLF